MVEMTIGSRFWYNGKNSKLCEVVETKSRVRCAECVFSTNDIICPLINCTEEKRHDGKNVYFKEVKDE